MVFSGVAVRWDSTSNCGTHDKAPPPGVNKNNSGSGDSEEESLFLFSEFAVRFGHVVSLY